MVPKTLNGWITLVVGIGLAVCSTYMGINPKSPLWVVLLNAGLAYTALAIKGGGLAGGK